MTERYPHLDEETRALMDRPIGERLNWFRTEFWIEYPASQRMLDNLSDLITKPRRGRMAGYLLTGESNNGKSAIAQEFARMHPSYMDPKSECVQLPVLCTEIGPGPTDASIVGGLLDALGIPYRPKDPYEVKLSLVIDGLKTLNVRVLILDELQRILGSRREQRTPIMDLLRYLSNKGQVPLVIMTTPRGAGVLASSDEMINRLAPVALPAWQLDAEFQSLLGSFELRLPLPEPSLLMEPKLAALIHQLSEGLIGETYDLLEMALKIALYSNKSRLTLELIRDLPWVKPSERKRQVRSAVTV